MLYPITDGFEHLQPNGSIELLLTAPQGMYRVFAVTLSGTTGSIQFEADYGRFQCAKFHAQGLVMAPGCDPMTSGRVFNDMGEPVYSTDEPVQ